MCNPLNTYQHILLIYQYIPLTYQHIALPYQHTPLIYQPREHTPAHHRNVRATLFQKKKERKKRHLHTTAVFVEQDLPLRGRREGGAARVLGGFQEAGLLNVVHRLSRQGAALFQEPAGGQGAGGTGEVA